MKVKTQLFKIYGIIAKAILRGKLYMIQTSLKKARKILNNVTFSLKELEQNRSQCKQKEGNNKSHR